jgi:hypothetical protein
MIGWVRSLPSRTRYLVYVAGALLLFLLALGVGATATVVVGRQLGVATTGPGETTAPDGSKLETTGASPGSKDTTIEPSGGNDSEGTAHEASFVHRATDTNSRGDYTYISDPSIDGDPNAVVLASRISNAGSSGTGSYDHHIGVWYESGARRWAIFNQDRAPVPAGSAFRVEVPRASASFVHRADLLNTASSYTYVDNRLTNGKPGAVLSVTQNWNPGGGRGVYNDHPVGTVYDARTKQWAIYNRDGGPITEGAAFNIAVSAGSDTSVR